MSFIKRYLLVIILSLFFMKSTDSLAKLPDFRIARPDSTYFGGKNLKKNTPTLFMYFSPTCDECIRITDIMLLLGSQLSQMQVVMICNESLKSVKTFTDQHHLATCKNVIVGTEGITGRFIQDNPVEKLPFLAFYNEQGAFVKQYDEKVPIKEFLLECIKH